MARMKRTRCLLRTMICALFICSCTVEMNQMTAVSESIPPTPSSSVFPVTEVPVTWAHLNLTGRLVYLTTAMEGDQLMSKIEMLDLGTGEAATLFRVSGAWIYYASISPDAKLLAMSYAPPGESNASSVRSLYTLSLEASAEPRPLFPPPTSADRYTQAEWSPDGEYIYYVHYNQDKNSENHFFEDYDISRRTYPAGEHETIREHALWPRLSPDSTRMVYVSIDPASGTNELFVANADGSRSRRVDLTGSQPFDILDAPLFSPDGQSILFSAPQPALIYQPNLLERLTGIQVARAHSVPSDWWSVPLAGGSPTRLTNLQTINLFASISPDQQHLASLSGEGIFVMGLDGSNLTQLVSDPGVHGTVSWIP